MDEGDSGAWSARGEERGGKKRPVTKRENEKFYELTRRPGFFSVDGEDRRRRTRAVFPYTLARRWILGGEGDTALPARLEI